MRQEHFLRFVLRAQGFATQPRDDAFSAALTSFLLQVQHFRNAVAASYGIGALSHTLSSISSLVARKLYVNDLLQHLRAQVELYDHNHNGCM